MRVEIWSDFVSPLCYIAKRKFDLALEQFAQRQFVNVEYKSFLLHKGETVRANTCRELLMETCKIPQNRLDEWIRDVNKEAEQLHLPINLNSFALVDTLDAHRLMKFAERVGKDTDLIDLLFEHFFKLEDKSKNNINDQYVLIRIAEKCGLKNDEVKNLLSLKKYGRAVEVDVSDADEIGIENVPFFIFNEKNALVGNHSVDVFLEALEVSWKEDEERLLKKHEAGPSKTNFCEGEDCEV